MNALSFLDGLSVMVLLILWGQAVFNYRKLPDIIPVHFDLQGEPDGHGAKFFIFLLPVFGTVMYYFLSYSVDEIHNFPFEITEENRQIQTTIGITAVKVIITYVLYIFFVFQKHIIQLSRTGTAKKLPVSKLLAGLFITIFTFLIIAFVNK